jgi:hypothetical protein
MRLKIRLTGSWETLQPALAIFFFRSNLQQAIFLQTCLLSDFRTSGLPDFRTFLTIIHCQRFHQEIKLAALIGKCLLRKIGTHKTKIEKIGHQKRPLHESI